MSVTEELQRMRQIAVRASRAGYVQRYIRQHGHAPDTDNATMRLYATLEAPYLTTSRKRNG